MYNLGCSRGQAASVGQNVVIVLDFGYPAYDSSSGQYGAKLLNDYTFHSTGDIANVAEGFLGGFYSCSPSVISLTLAIGINNYPHDPNNVTQAHGVAWAQMVNNINSWIVGPPYPSFADKLVAWGAIDAEPAWNTALATRAWVGGYASAYSGQSKYLDFGSCDGCAYTGHAWGSPWQPDDVWYVAWGATPAYPLPEIYLVSGINADQWYHMSSYAYTNHPTSMGFKGSLTQWNACQENQQINPNACVYANDRSDNTPSQGYLQLYNAINADPHTARSMPWSTDMSWQK
jgi:hypothetical protein